MTIGQISVLIFLALLLGRLRAARQLALLAASIAIAYWLQAATPVASLAFWLPSATLSMTMFSWAVTSSPENRRWSQVWPAAVTILGTIVIVGMSRWLEFPLALAAAAPGPIMTALALAAISLGIWVTATSDVMRRAGVLVAVSSIILAFAVLKTPALLGSVTSGLLQLQGATEAETATIPLAWLGFSYVAFRLLHTLRDRQTGRLPALSLAEYVNYVMFFPAFVAGPIDRVERFVEDLRQPNDLRDADWLNATIRIATGLFKKFVVAELLAVISINDLFVRYVTSPAWMLLFLYAYALRVYFDFSGYTDVAIGLGRLLGVKLPENFAAPYLKPNIALFWNSWHMSLTQWFRSYVFNPLTRQLRSGRILPPAWLSILIAQLTTMILIGLWHGVTWGFAAWGLWHGAGLFLHNRWTAATREFWARRTLSPAWQRATSIAGVFVTFHFVTIGWLFFTLSTPGLVWRALQVLAGAA